MTFKRGKPSHTTATRQQREAQAIQGYQYELRILLLAAGVFFYLLVVYTD